MFRLMTFWSINVLRIVKVLLLIMKSIELLTSCIHFTFVIFRRSYNYRKLMTSIMKRFFWVVSSRTRQSYKDFESIQNTKRMNISKMFETISFKIASRSKSWIIAYNFAARTLRVIRLHFIDDQWITFILRRKSNSTRNNIINLKKHVSIDNKKRVSENNQLKLFRIQFYEFEIFNMILDLSNNSLIQNHNNVEKMINRLSSNK